MVGLLGLQLSCMQGNSLKPGKGEEMEGVEKVRLVGLVTLLRKNGEQNEGHSGDKIIL